MDVHGRSYHYVERASATATAVAVEKELPLIISSLHTAPYIWLSRIVIIVYILLFLLLIRIAWQRKALAPHPRMLPLEPTT